MNHELLDVEAGFRKMEELEIKLPTSVGRRQEEKRTTEDEAIGWHH